MTDNNGTDHLDEETAGTRDDEIDPGWPWSFILLVVAGALYLIFRFVEMGIKLFS
jgi:hypothetical protein